MLDCRGRRISRRLELRDDELEVCDMVDEGARVVSVVHAAEPCPTECFKDGRLDPYAPDFGCWSNLGRWCLRDWDRLCTASPCHARCAMGLKLRGAVSERDGILLQVAHCGAECRHVRSFSEKPMGTIRATFRPDFGWLPRTSPMVCGSLGGVSRCATA